MKRALLTTLAVAGGLAVAVPAFAQTMGPGGGGPGMMHRMHGGGPGGGFARMCNDQDARLAGMLAYAEKRLNITEAQRAAWTKFADAARASTKPVQDACATLKDRPAATTLPDRLDRMNTVMTARQAQFSQMLPAVKEMYGQLTPEQQKTADSLMSRGRGMGGPMGGPGDGPRGPGGPGSQQRGG